MKKITSITLLLLTAVFLNGEEAKKSDGPKKGTIDTYRVFPKQGHAEEFKAAMGAHAQKYHTGSWKWRVSEILTGPDTGGFMILEGPNSWTDMEGRGDLGAEHTKDYESTIAPHVDRSSPELYATYVADSSTVAPGAFSSNKTLVSFGYLKPGRGEKARADLKTWKKIYEKLGLNMVVWRSFYSGEECLVISSRLKDGLRDLDDESINFRKTADELLGPGKFDELVESDTANYSRIVDEIMEFRPEMSSK